MTFERYLRCSECGGIAVRLADDAPEPEMGQEIRLKHFRHIDGTPFKAGEPLPVCLGCGEAFSWLPDVVETARLPMDVV
jgi:hypothetical protein